MTTDLKDLRALLDLLSAKGVRSYRDATNSMMVEFHPPESESQPEPKPTADPDLCLCGHFAHEHINGLCLKDCPPQKCAGPDNK